jgi:hypothetical protein
LPISVAAQRLGKSAGALRLRCEREWSAAGLAQKSADGQWFISPAADPQLRDRVDCKQRDLEQIAQLRAARTRPKDIKIAEARRDILVAFDAFALRHGNLSRERVVKLFIADCYATGRVGSDKTIKRFKRNAYYDWSAKYKQDGLSALVPKFDKSGERPKESIGASAWGAFLRFKHQPGDPSIKECWKLVGALAAAEHAGDAEWSWPKYRTVLAHYVETVHPAAQSSLRIGPHKTEGAFLPKITRCLEDIAAAKSPAATSGRWTRLPLPGGDGKWRMIRPKLTAWLDVRSRFFGGWVLEESGNSDTILAAYKMHCLVTETVSDEAICDNGEDYRSVAGRANRHRKWDKFDSGRVRGAFERLGVQVHFDKVRTPSAKMIESHFIR